MSDSSERADQIIDAWEEAEGESMRDGHRSTLRDLIAAAIAQAPQVSEDAREIAERLAIGLPISYNRTKVARAVEALLAPILREKEEVEAVLIETRLVAARRFEEVRRFFLAQENETLEECALRRAELLAEMQRNRSADQVARVEAERQLAALKEENERLRDYASHDPRCPAAVAGGQGCNCGLLAALSPATVARAAVGGQVMERSTADFVRACEVLIAEEQEQPLPRTHLIAVLCDAVRLTREMARTVGAGSPATGAGPEKEET